MTHSLRPYQRTCVDTLTRVLYKSNRALVHLPTSAGKTLIFTEFLKRFELPGRKFIVVVNRGELVSQTVKKFHNVFKSVSVYSAGYGQKSTDGNVIVASIQSLDDVVIPNLACVVFDEVHNFGSMEGRYGRFLKAHPHAKVIGFTATPWSNNKPIYGEGKFFESVTFHESLRNLIAQGYIVPPVLKAPPHQFDVSTLRLRLGEYVQEDVDRITLDLNKMKLQVEDAIPRLLYRKKILWVCASIEHARLLMGVIKHATGEPCAILHSKLTKELQVIQRNVFENTPCRHICCVMMATEGYDFSEIDAVAFMRPTRSAVLFVQVVGRALRLHPGKKDALILDYGNVVENCGPLDDPKIVNYNSALPKEAMRYSVWTCPTCASYVEHPNKICNDCGYEKVSEVRDVMSSLSAKAYEGTHTLFGNDEGTFKVRDVTIKAHVARKSKLPSIHVKYRLEGRDDFDDYSNVNQWKFKWPSFKELIVKSRVSAFNSSGGGYLEGCLEFDNFNDVYSYFTRERIASGDEEIFFETYPDEITIKKTPKGYRNCTLKWPERSAD